MIIRELEVKKQNGIRNEDAQNIVRRAMRYNSDIYFEFGTKKVNAKSLMGIIAMGLKAGDKVMVIIRGDDQEEAVEEIRSLL